MALPRTLRVRRALRARWLVLGVVLATTVAGLDVADAQAADPEPSAPVQLLTLTDDAGAPTDVATAGLGDPDGASADDSAGTTSGGNAVSPALSARLRALVRAEGGDPGASGTAADGATGDAGDAAQAGAQDAAQDPDQDAAVLTQPLDVDEFLVAGFTWDGAATLPEGTELSMRVRENGVWSDWYVSEVDGSGRDDGAGSAGTVVFISGGADAVQVRASGDVADLPAGLELALVPASPDGQEQLDPDELGTTQAPPTPTADDEHAPAGSDGAVEGDAAPTSTTPASGPTGDASGTSGGGAAVNPALVLPATTTTNGLPIGVVSRAEWGANPAYLDWTPTYVAASHAIVHHTVGTNSYTMSQSASIVAGIYYYHAVTLDWGDIGYNFLVDKYGQVFEGRSGTLSSPSGQMVVAAHARGANTGSMGISMMGTYTTASPTSAQLTNVGRLAGWLLGRAGVTNASGSAGFTIRTSNGMYAAGQVISLPYVSGHRDVYPTACPGDAGYAKLGTIRSAAQTILQGSDRWVLTDGRWYLQKTDGTRLTGWNQVAASWYYLGSDGAMATGWINVSGTWYYLQPSGAMQTGWAKIASTWYYFQPSGAMQTGWAKIGSAWYYFQPSGAMATGWAKIGSAWYYLGPNGAMATGWTNVSGTWYYLQPSGAMQTGWAQIGSAWYYLGSNGAMATGVVLIDGTWSRFAADGSWSGYTGAPASGSATTLTPIMAAPTSTRSVVVTEMVSAFQGSGRTYPSAALTSGGASTVRVFAETVYDEAVAEGVSPELVFSQAMKETGWLQFGGDVSVKQFNFGGIGATGGGASGATFADVRTGIRAQVQHLRAYADATVTTSSLAHPVVDPRFAYVTKGSARYVEYLGIQENPSHLGWATAAGYGTSLVSMMNQYF